MARTLVERVHGISEFMDYDERTGDLVVERVQDVEPTLKAVHDEAMATGGRGKTMWHIGELPYAVWSMYGRLRGLPDNWVYLREYAGEVVKLIAENPRLSPTSGKC